MHIDILNLIEGAKQAQGLTVIIDVFRAFSTACYVVRNGAGQIIPVGDVELAYKLKEENPDYVLMGERQGKMLPGFDYGNSPTAVEAVDFSGKTVIQTTSAGTQGFANAKDADELITGSFVNAEAIVAYIRNKSPVKVSLVCMGTWAVKANDEDTLCAEYIAGRLNNRKFDKEEIYRLLRDSKTARIFFDPAVTWAPETDFDLCLNIGLCDFVLKAEQIENDLLGLKPIYIC
ncbi:MAG: 2-phosphosulfolactate phosphatase [Deltaproteobacteria bacterium]|jgi:2-phosphosulfolactate phosphatase|nr:2-phosphosulfolactate phosphatase [Deltaproteobacteria bacterium]